MPTLNRLLYLLVFLAVKGQADTIVVTNSADSGNGTLRQAILHANTNPGPDSITFNIPGTGVHSLTPAAAYPSILEPLSIDGTTQPGYSGKPLVELNGSNAGQSYGLWFLGGNSVLKGLAINRFAMSGVWIQGIGTNAVQSCFIGTDPTGTIARPNGENGILVDNSRENRLGGAEAGEGNLLSANRGAGVYLYNGGWNVVEGNLIGTDLSGTSALGNGYGGTNHGVITYDSGSNRIGRVSASASRNVISGNRGVGVYFFRSRSRDNICEGNLIGVDITGSKALANHLDGVAFAGAQRNRLGGPETGQGNTISGNGQAGVLLTSFSSENAIQGNLIGTDSAGLVAVANATAGVIMSGAGSNVIGGASVGAGNVISGNTREGVVLTNTVGVTLAGNLIGSDKTGTKALENRFNGVSVYGAHFNRIGGAEALARNVISGNAFHGVHIAFAASTNRVEGNLIGLDATGAMALKNKVGGIRIESDGNRVGSPGAGNVVSGNGTNGVFIVGSSASNNCVAANFVGTDPSGATARGNGEGGIGISDASSNIVGGAAPGEANVVSGNQKTGIFILGKGAVGNRVIGNRVGTDAAGLGKLANLWEGIYLQDCRTNVIGEPGAGNLVSGNDGRGIWLANACWNRVDGNLVGTRVDGSPGLGNAWHGIEASEGCTNNVIGSVAGGNRVASAQGVYAGVRIRTGAVNNSIMGGSIFANGALGIDLGDSGILPNDSCDADSGANKQQNYPVLTQAATSNGTGVRGTLSSTASRTFLLQFYGSPSCDPSGNGEGQLFLGSTSVPTGGACGANFVANFATAIPSGWVVTATATDEAQNTSEFSGGMVATPAPTLSAVRESEGQLAFSWPSSSTGFVLRRCSGMEEPIQWVQVPGTSAVENGRFVLRAPVEPGNAFFVLSFE